MPGNRKSTLLLPSDSYHLHSGRWWPHKSPNQSGQRLRKSLPTGSHLKDVLLKGKRLNSVKLLLNSKGRLQSLTRGKPLKGQRLSRRQNLLSRNSNTTILTSIWKRNPSLSLKLRRSGKQSRENLPTSGKRQLQHFLKRRPPQGKNRRGRPLRPLRRAWSTTLRKRRSSTRASSLATPSPQSLSRNPSKKRPRSRARCSPSRARCRLRLRRRRRTSARRRPIEGSRRLRNGRKRPRGGLRTWRGRGTTTP